MAKRGHAIEGRFEGYGGGRGLDTNSVLIPSAIEQWCCLQDTPNDSTGLGAISDMRVVVFAEKWAIYENWVDKPMQYRMHSS